MTRTEPWLTEEANKILEKMVLEKPNLSVFEFGAGASTMWFSKQENVTTLVSVESNYDWYIKVTSKLINEKGIVIFSEMPYNNAIDAFGLFDIILIDGRNRNLCIKSAISHLKQDGVIILDNSEREHYAPGISLLKEFKRIDTLQPLPDKYGFTYPGWQTSFFMRCFR